MCYPGFPQLPPAWPGLAARYVTIGGVTCTVEAARQAAAIMAASRTSAIAPVLGKAGNPLAACDYFGASAPYLFQMKRLAKTGRAGAAGRHVTKLAFTEAIKAAIDGARRADVASVLHAFASDERYAAAIASDATRRAQKAVLLQAVPAAA